MKSQVIKVRNIPFEGSPTHQMMVKPVPFLIITTLLGGYLLLFQPSMRVLGVFLFLLSPFALLVLPNRHLLQVFSEGMVLYNERDYSSCQLIYWDEIVNWTYEKHYLADLFVVTLIDGSTESIEVYARRPIAKFMKQYCPNKEIKRNWSNKGEI